MKEKILQSIIFMLKQIKSDDELMRIHRFVQYIYDNKKK